MPTRLYLCQDAEDRLFTKWANWLLIQIPGEKILHDFVNRYRSTFAYRLLIDPRTTQKSWERCIQKVSKYVDVGQATDEIAAVENCLKDTAGARIILLFPRDREVAVARFRTYVNKNGMNPPNGLPHFVLDGNDEIKSYETGYKAIHQGILLQMNAGEWTAFEVQFMNVLQHMWDKIQGPLYRDPDRYPNRLRRKVANLSTTCDKVCHKTNEILIEIAERHRRAR